MDNKYKIFNRKLKRKSQLTLFIIIGISILMLSALVFYLSSYIKSGKLDIGLLITSREKEEAEIKTYISACINDVSLPLIEEIGKHGGTFLLNSGIHLNNYELNPFCTYNADYGHLNNLVLRQNIESELSSLIKEGLDSCINLKTFEEKGFNVTSQDKKVTPKIGFDDVIVALNFPVTFKKEGYEINIEEFSSKIDLPLGRLYALAVDITNDEISKGFFDKEDWMLKHGNITIIEKHRIYPNTVYILKQFVKKYNKYLIFQFAIKGKDTVGKEVLRYDNLYGCCINKKDNFCFKNTDPNLCKDNIYNDSTDCICEENIKKEVEGCCVVGNRCLFTNEGECSNIKNSEFFKNDLRCSKANCAYLDCGQTYNYVTNDFSNPYKKHGESWCSYESIVGRGADYVGTRHYLHSCLYGKEYVEECRDYREELCSEEVIGQSGKYYSKARCRINRWYDCAEQTNYADCEDKTLRDCYWFECHPTDPLRNCTGNDNDYHGLWSQKKCHPQVSPGFKFWENNGKDVCNMASLNKSNYGNDYPRSWGYSTLLYCQRTGDCGNYRNFIDNITEFGYYNPQGSQLPGGKVDRWVYWEDGSINRGDEYVLKLDIDETGLASDVDMPVGPKETYVKCNVWKAPLYGNCSKCKRASLRPCTEYKCKSLGRNCVFQVINNSPTCVDADSTIIPSSGIELTGLQSGFSYTKTTHPSYPNTIEYKIEPSIFAYEPFNFRFSTSVKTRCLLTLYTPNIAPSAATDLPEVWLNSFDFKTDYDITMRFPSPSFLNNLNRISLFVKCYNEHNILNDREFMLNIGINDSSIDNGPPQIILAEPLTLVKNTENTISLYVDEVFIECRYSDSSIAYEDMNIFCDSSELDIVYEFDKPLGSARCANDIFISSDKLYFSCKDLNGNINGNYYIIST